MNIPPAPGSGDDRLIIFTRYPEPGRVKTRLIPTLGPHAAARLHREMTRHVLRTAQRLGESIRLELHFDQGAEPAMRALYGSGHALHPQQGADLGQRMHAAIQNACGQGAGRVVLIGTDCPLITPQIIGRAFQLLDTHACVLGPALDGGYYLIGLRQACPALFTGISWGTERVLAQTLERARAAGIATALLESLTDIDRAEDLHVWQSALQKTPPRIAAIIPALNEARRIVPAIQALRQDNSVDIIVADGGSTDETASLASAQGARVIAAPQGRARQLNHAAAQVEADILLFLHADTRVARGYAAAIRKTLADPCTIAGSFRLAFDAKRPGLKLMALGANLRSRYLRLPYGDQGIFLWAHDFHAAGGFPDLPLMDDAVFIRSLKGQGRIATTGPPVCTSARRYARLGLFSTWLINQCVLMAFALGGDPLRLAQLYRSQAGLPAWMALVRQALRDKMQQA